MSQLAIPLEATGAKPPQWAAAAKLLFSNWVSPLLRNNIKYVPRTSHTNSLGWTEHVLEKQLAGVKGPFTLAFDP